MKRGTLGLVGIAAVASVVAITAYVAGNRYSTTTGTAGIVYKLDRLTGRTTMIIGGEEKPVISVAAKDKVDPADRAIDLAKSAYTLDLGTNGFGNDGEIRKYLSEYSGPLRILGWNTRAGTEPHTYLVRYQFDMGHGPVGFYFEVNVDAALVRNVCDDEALAEHYGVDDALGSQRALSMRRLRQRELTR